LETNVNTSTREGAVVLSFLEQNISGIENWFIAIEHHRVQSWWSKSKIFKQWFFFGLN